MLSTSQDIYPNGRWVITVQSYAAIDPYNPFGYVDVTITNSTETDFITILNSHNPNMVFTTNDRAFYNEGIVLGSSKSCFKKDKFPPKALFSNEIIMPSHAKDFEST